MSTHLIQIEIPDGDNCSDCIFCDGEYADCNNPHAVEGDGLWRADVLKRPQWCHDQYDAPQHSACAHTFPAGCSDALLRDRIYCTFCGTRLSYEQCLEINRQRGITAPTTPPKIITDAREVKP